MRVLSSLLCRSRKELQEKLEIIRPFARAVHVDIMDGLFVPYRTVSLKSVAKLLQGFRVQLHVMCDHPEKFVRAAKKAGVKEFIFHAEATKDQQRLLKLVNKSGMRAGVALNPETPISAVISSSLYLVMTVHPGKSNQRLLPGSLKKIKQLKKLRQCVVGVDGGVRLSNKNKIKSAGADFVCVAHELFHARFPNKSFKLLSR